MLMSPRRGGRQITLRFRIGLTLMAVAATMLAGCSSGDAENDSTPAATSIPPVESTPTPSAHLGAVTWSTGIDEMGAPVDELDTFARDNPVIYAVVEVDTAPEGETLSAVWVLDDTPIDAIA